MWWVGLETADHRIPPQNVPQTTTGRTAEHCSLQDAKNNFISLQTWFHVIIKH